jgi:hypothetical protein
MNTTATSNTSSNNMSAALIAQLLVTFGPSAISLIDTLIAKIEQGGTVSSAEWAQMSADARRSAKDILLTRIAAAGLDPNDPKVATLVSMAS